MSFFRDRAQPPDQMFAGILEVAYAVITLIPLLVDHRDRVQIADRLHRLSAGRAV